MTDHSPGHLAGATVAVTGASGNLGTALLRRLTTQANGPAEVRGLARRQPPAVVPYEGVRWFTTDLAEPASDGTLREFLDGVDAVVHLAWAIQPGRQPDLLKRVNVDGTGRVARAAAAAGVAHVVHLSSVGAYTEATVGQVVGEDWPTTGIPSSQYSRDKAEAEVTMRHGVSGDVVLSVVRPTLVLQPDAGSEIGRYFLGPLLFGAARKFPGRVARMLPLPLPDLSVGFVHADDVADALVRILDRRASGPFNLTAEPLLDADGLARALGTRRIPFPAVILRAAVSAAFLARLIPTEPGWLDLAVRAPSLDATRARTLLDWAPERRGDAVLAEFVAALARGEGGDGPLLYPAAD